MIPGTLFRAELNARSPLTWGAPELTYFEQLGESPLTPTATGVNAAVYPKGDDFWFSGYAEGESVLKGTAALVEEKLGEGRVILFAGEPNFRSFTEATQLLLANAIAYPAGGGGGSDVATARFAAGVNHAMRSVSPTSGPGRPIQIAVAERDTSTTALVMSEFTSNYSSARLGDWIVFTIPNPRGLDFEAHPYSFELLRALQERVDVRAAIL